MAAVGVDWGAAGGGRRPEGLRRVDIGLGRRHVGDGEEMAMSVVVADYPTFAEVG